MNDLFSQHILPKIGGDRLLISMSGGRSSAFMARKILRDYSHLWGDIVTVFANTGQEDEKTLNFVNNCDKYFGFNTKWVEAVVNPEHGTGTKHREVSFGTASRNGEPFEAVIAKYGIPNLKHPHCTRELKQRAIESYAASLGWGRDYVTAIGIRSDEMRRVNQRAADRKIVYPMVDWFAVDKQDVNDWWEEQSFNLELEEHQGNCKWCWKKSFVKHAKLIQEDETRYDFPSLMEKKYGYVGPEKEPDESFPRVFFRGNRSVSDLKRYCQEIGVRPVKFNQADDNSGCGESCEVYPTSQLF